MPPTPSPQRLVFHIASVALALQPRAPAVRRITPPAASAPPQQTATDFRDSRLGFPGARCNSTNPAVVIARTADSALVICETGVGRFYYRGVGLISVCPPGSSPSISSTTPLQSQASHPTGSSPTPRPVAPVATDPAGRSAWAGSAKAIISSWSP